MTTAKRIVEKSEFHLLRDFWQRIQKCVADVRQNGHRGSIPPDDVGYDWDEDFERSYENIRPFLREFRNEKFYEVPPGIPNCTTPFVAETGHQAFMFFLNPTNVLYGASPFWRTREFQVIQDAAVSELMKMQGRWTPSGDFRTKPSVRNHRKNRNGQLSDDGLLLHAYLFAGHKCNSEEPYFEPLGNQHFIAKQLLSSRPNWNGTRVSRAMKELLEQDDAFPLMGNRYMDRYQKLCEEKQICSWLVRIQVRTMSRGFEREFGAENLDRFHKLKKDE